MKAMIEPSIDDRICKCKTLNDAFDLLADPSISDRMMDCCGVQLHSPDADARSSTDREKEGI
jgi:hypothetical protein